MESDVHRISVNSVILAATRVTDLCIEEGLQIDRIIAYVTLMIVSIHHDTNILSLTHSLSLSLSLSLLSFIYLSSVHHPALCDAQILGDWLR